MAPSSSSDKFRNTLGISRPRGRQAGRERSENRRRRKPRSESPPRVTVGSAVVVTASPLRLRSGEDSSSERLGRLAPGARVTVTRSHKTGFSFRTRVEVTTPTKGWVTAVKEDGTVLLREDSDFQDHVNRHQDAHWKPRADLFQPVIPQWTVDHNRMIVPRDRASSPSPAKSKASRLALGHGSVSPPSTRLRSAGRKAQVVNSFKSDDASYTDDILARMDRMLAA